MPSLNELSRLLSELEEQLVTCMRCGMCQAVCPLYAETGLETDVARGKIVLLEQLSTQLLQDPEAVAERLEKCLLCGSCAAACPSGVRVLDLFLKARAFISGYLKLSPVKKVLFRQILMRPALLDGLAFLASRCQGIFTRQTSDMLGASCARIETAWLQDRHFALLAATPWHRQTPVPATARRTDGAGRSGHRNVAFFYGCLADKVFPDIARSAYRLLHYQGAVIHMPHAQVCCGIPALAAGDRQGFIQLVRRNLHLFGTDRLQYMVTPCATCTAVIKEIWPMMASYFSPSEQAVISRIAAITMDITQFLADETPLLHGRAQTEETPKRITYHDPCHLKKTLNVHSQPRDLLRRIPGYEFVEMEEADRCCGMGGSFGMQHYDLSKKVAQRKLDHIRRTGADVVGTACPACMLQLIDLLSRNRMNIRVLHVVQAYAQHLPGE